MKSQRTEVDSLAVTDLPSLEELLDSYSDMVMTLCARVIGDPVLAEEAVQDVFVKVHKNLKGFKAQSSLKTWIYSIAYRTAIDYTRRRKRYSGGAVEISEIQYATDAENAQTSMENRESKEWLHRGIAKLPAELKGIIKLYYLEEKNIKEVSEITGLTESNVKTKLFRARKRLFVILENDKKHL